MTIERYWVVGGDYSCMAFQSLRGGGQLAGPFDSREEAVTAWRRLSGESSSRATARYSITVETFRPAV